MTRQLSVSALGRSWESGSFQDKTSYRVATSEGNKRVVFEARIAVGTLETLDNPEERICTCSAARTCRRYFWKSGKHGQVKLHDWSKGKVVEPSVQQ